MTLNVACLNRAPFNEILSGSKRNEYRIRKRPDPRLEAIQPGEQLVFLERGTDRALECTVLGCERFDPHDPTDPDGDFPDYCYDIELAEKVRLIAAPGVRHLQGWSRRASLALPSTPPGPAPSPSPVSPLKTDPRGCRVARTAKTRRRMPSVVESLELAEEMREMRKRWK